MRASEGLSATHCLFDFDNLLVCVMSVVSRLPALCRHSCCSRCRLAFVVDHSKYIIPSITLRLARSAAFPVACMQACWNSLPPMPVDVRRRIQSVLPFAVDQFQPTVIVRPSDGSATLAGMTRKDYVDPWTLLEDYDECLIDLADFDALRRKRNPSVYQVCLGWTKPTCVDFVFWREGGGGGGWRYPDAAFLSLM